MRAVFTALRLALSESGDEVLAAKAGACFRNLSVSPMSPIHALLTLQLPTVSPMVEWVPLPPLFVELVAIRCRCAAVMLLS